MRGTETMLVSGRNGIQRRGIRFDRARRHAPLLQVAPEVRVFLIERPHLAVGASTEPTEVDDAALIDEMTVADIVRKRGIEGGILGEALRAHGPHALENRIVVEWKTGGRCAAQTLGTARDGTNERAGSRRTMSTNRVAKNARPTAAASCAVVKPNATVGTSRAKSSAKRNPHISIPCT